jgi:hypothetical protein
MCYRHSWLPRHPLRRKKDPVVPPQDLAGSTIKGDTPRHTYHPRDIGAASAGGSGWQVNSKASSVMSGPLPLSASSSEGKSGSCGSPASSSTAVTATLDESRAGKDEGMKDVTVRGSPANFSGRRRGVSWMTNSIWAAGGWTGRGNAEGAAQQRVQACLRVALRDSSVEVLQVLSRGGLASVYRGAVSSLAHLPLASIVLPLHIQAHRRFRGYLSARMCHFRLAVMKREATLHTSKDESCRLVKAKSVVHRIACSVFQMPQCHYSNLDILNLWRD